MTEMETPDRAEWVRALVAEYEGRLCRYAERILADVERARDAVQETFLRLWEAERAGVEGHAAEWLFAVCRTRCLDILNKERRMTPIAEKQEAVLTSRHADPPSTVSRQETEAQMLAALAELPANQREVIRLKFQEDLSYRQISRITGLSETNVGFLIHQGVSALRRRLT